MSTYPPMTVEVLCARLKRVLAEAKANETPGHYAGAYGWLCGSVGEIVRQALDEPLVIEEAPPLCNSCGTSDHLTESPAGERCREREARDAIQGQHLLGPNV